MHVSRNRMVTLVGISIAVRAGRVFASCGRDVVKALEI